MLDLTHLFIFTLFFKSGADRNVGFVTYNKRKYDAKNPSNS